MADKNGYRGGRTGRGTEALTQRKADVEARKAAEHITSNLNTFTLGGDEGASATNMATMTNAIHIQDSNLEALDTVNTINEALFRDGRHIPGTGQIVTATATESGVRTVVHTAAAGEVWRVISMTIESVAGGSGSVTYDIYAYDTVNGVLQAIAKRAVTSPPVIINDEVEYPAGLELDENIQLQFSATRTSLSSAVIQVLMYRIR